MSEELLAKIRVALWEATIRNSDDAIDVVERIYREENKPTVHQCSIECAGGSDCAEGKAQRHASAKRCSEGCRGGVDCEGRR